MNRNYNVGNTSSLPMSMQSIYQRKFSVEVTSRDGGAGEPGGL